MQFKRQISAILLLATATVSNAWTFTAYPKLNFQGTPVVVTGTIDAVAGFTACEAINPAFQVASFTVNADIIKTPDSTLVCGWAAFDKADCAGDIIYVTVASWNLLNFHAEVPEVQDTRVAASIGVKCILLSQLVGA